MLAAHARKLIGQRVVGRPSAGPGVAGTLLRIEKEQPSFGATRAGRSWAVIRVEEVLSWPTNGRGRPSKRTPFPPQEGAEAVVGIMNVEAAKVPRVPYVESLRLAYLSFRLSRHYSAESEYFAARAPHLAKEAREDLATLDALAPHLPPWTPTARTVIRRAVPILLNGWALDGQGDRGGWTVLQEALPKAARQLDREQLLPEVEHLLETHFGTRDLVDINNRLQPTRNATALLEAAARGECWRENYLPPLACRAAGGPQPEGATPCIWCARRQDEHARRTPPGPPGDSRPRG